MPIFVRNDVGVTIEAADDSRVVKAAVDEATGRVPLLAGCGYGGRVAMEFARAAEQAPRTARSYFHRTW